MDNSFVQPAPVDTPPPSPPDGEPLMEFGEVELRPLEKKAEPSRDRSFATQMVGALSTVDLPIFIDKAACEDVETHAREDTDNEVGGVLLGKQYEGRSGPYVLIVKALPAKHVEHSGTHLKFTHETWETLSREKDDVAPDLDIVGWYHTHPGLTVFMSSYDRFIHDNFFNRPQDIALVVDPIANDRGFFHWENTNGRKLRRCTGFHLVAPRHEKVALQQLSQSLQTRPLSPYAIPGGTADMEADMNRITFRDLVLAVFVLIAVFQSLTMLSFSHQRMMAQEMFAAMPFTEGDYIRKSHSLLKEKQELIKKRDSLEKQVKELEDKKQSLETKHTATQNKVEQLTKSETDLKGKVESLQSNQKRLEQQIKRLGGKVPRGFFSQTAPLWVVIGGGILLAALASAVAIFVTMRKFQQELLKAQSQKPSA